MLPLELETWGHMFAGGQIDDSVAGSPMVGQLYAEYWIPAKRSFPYPVVMVHGGRQMGTNFTRTPDGREGWAQYFVRRGVSVFVVDQVACGRSPHWSRSEGIAAAPDLLTRTQQRFVAPSQAHLWPQAKHHTQWPGNGKPGDCSFDQFYASQVPALADRTRAVALNRDALVALLDKIGPAVLLTHSQSGAFGWPVADARPELVKAIAAIEPAGPPVRDIDMVGSPNWFVDAGPPKPWGLSRVPLTYDPPLMPTEQLRFVRQTHSERPGQACGWLQDEPARQLVNLENIPVLIVTTEASYHAVYDQHTAAYLRQAGVPTTSIRLADVDTHGNGHMMMLERNSDDTADHIHRWLTDTLAGPDEQER